MSLKIQFIFSAVLISLTASCVIKSSQQEGRPLVEFEILESAEINTFPITTFELYIENYDASSIMAVTNEDPNIVPEEILNGKTYFKPIVDENGFITFELIQSIKDIPDGEKGKNLLKFGLACNGIKYTKEMQFKILEVNDQPPKFDKLTYKFEMQKIVPVGYIINLGEELIVTDDDVITKEYPLKITIEEGGDLFDLKAKLKVVPRISSFNVEIRTKQNTYLKDEYTLILKATDGQFITMSTVKIKISGEINLLDPIFKKESYTATLILTEDNTDGTVLVKEKDEDAGEASLGFKFEKMEPEGLEAFDQDKLLVPVDLSFEIVNDIKWIEYFEIEKQTDYGKIKLKLKKEIDREFYSQTSISIAIKVYETEEIKRSSFTMVTIKIVKPETKVFYFTQEIELPKYTKIDTSVYELKLSSSSSSVDDEKILTGRDESFFSLSDDKMKVLLKKPLQESGDETLEIEIEVKSKSKISSFINRIKVEFNIVESDKCGLFSRSVYAIDLLPETEIGTQVFHLETKKETLFEIKDGDSKDQFSIDSKTGMISLSKKIDQSKYEIEVKGVLIDEPKTEETVRLIFYVEDCQLKKKLFTESFYKIEISDNTAPGLLELNIVPDGLKNVEYFKIQGKEKFFKIEKTGGIRLLKNSKELPDFQYLLVIGAFYGNSDSKPIQGMQTSILIEIKTSPIFQVQSPFVKLLLPNANKKDYALQIIARSQNGGEIEYSIEETKLSDNFEINSGSGELYAIKDVEKLETKIFEIKVKAKVETKESTIDVKIIRLTQSETIVFEIENSFDNILEIQKILSNVTGYNIQLLQVDEVPNGPRTLYSSSTNRKQLQKREVSKIVIYLAALTNENKPITITEFKKKSPELNGIFVNNEISDYKEPELPSTLVQRNSEESNTGLIVAVAILGCICGILVLSALVFFLMRTYRPNTLSSKFHTPLKRAPTPPRKRSQISLDEKDSLQMNAFPKSTTNTETTIAAAPTTAKRLYPELLSNGGGGGGAGGYVNQSFRTENEFEASSFNSKRENDAPSTETLLTLAPPVVETVSVEAPKQPEADYDLETDSDLCTEVLPPADYNPHLDLPPPPPSSSSSSSSSSSHPEEKEKKEGKMTPEKTPKVWPQIEIMNPSAMEGENEDPEEIQKEQEQEQEQEQEEKKLKINFVENKPQAKKQIDKKDFSSLSSTREEDEDIEGEEIEGSDEDEEKEKEEDEADEEEEEEIKKESKDTFKRRKRSVVKFIDEPEIIL